MLGYQLDQNVARILDDLDIASYEDLMECRVRAWDNVATYDIH